MTTVSWHVEASPPRGGPATHLSAALGADQLGDGAEVVVVGPDEDPEERGLRAAPLHRLGLAAQLHLHGGLTARVPLCQRGKNKVISVSLLIFFFCENLRLLKGPVCNFWPDL